MICSEYYVKDVSSTDVGITIKDEHSYDSPPDDIHSVHNDHQYDETSSKSEDHIYAMNQDAKPFPEMMPVNSVDEIDSTSKVEVDSVAVDYDSFAHAEDCKHGNASLLAVGNQVDAYTEEEQPEECSEGDDRSNLSGAVEFTHFQEYEIDSPSCASQDGQTCSKRHRRVNEVDVDISFVSPLKRSRIDIEPTHSSYTYRIPSTDDELVFSNLMDAVKHISTSEALTDKQIIIAVNKSEDGILDSNLQTSSQNNKNGYKVMYHLLLEGRDLYFEDINDIMCLLKYKGETFSRKHISLCKRDESKCVTIQKNVANHEIHSYAKTDSKQKKIPQGGVHSYAKPPQTENTEYCVASSSLGVDAQLAEDQLKAKALLRAKDEEIGILRKNLLDREQRIEALTEIISSLVEKLSNFERTAVQTVRSIQD